MTSKERKLAYQKRWLEKLRQRGGRLINGRVEWRPVKPTPQQTSDLEMDRIAAEWLAKVDR